MAPKKDKDRTDENHWRAFIEEAPLNEYNWQVKVVVLEIAGSAIESVYLNRFETSAKEEKRFVIKNISKSETIFMINQLGVEKKVKDENLQVFEEGYSFLKEKKDIPSEVLALIIKHLILKMKEEHISIQHQKLVVREGMRTESLTMIDRTEVRNSIPAHGANPAEPAASPPTKPKGYKDENDSLNLTVQRDEDKKYNTLLRVRGEEWRDKIYVDDYPIDGANIYVAITGFMDPYLLDSLIKIGVPLTAVVQIRMNPMSNKSLSAFTAGMRRGHSASDYTTEKSFKFWETVQQLRLNKASADYYKNIAFIVFTPPYRSSEVISDSFEKVYDELSFLMYDIQDLTRQHYHYLDSMDVKYIPAENQIEKFLEQYYHHIDEIPLECVTVFSILDSILQAICVSHQNYEKSSRSSLSTSSTLIKPSESIKNLDKIKKAETLIKKVIKTLSKSDLDKKKYRVTCGEEYDNYKDPVVLNYGDFVKYTTFHLDHVNIDPVVSSSLLHMPICNLWKNQLFPSDELKAKTNFHVNTLLSCFDKENIDDSLLNRLLHVLSFRKLYNDRNSVKKKNIPSSTITEFKKVYLKRSTLAEPLPKNPSLFWTSGTNSPPCPVPVIVKSDSYSNKFSNRSDPEVQHIEVLFDYPDISELVSAAEIMNDKPMNHLVDDYDFFEDFSDICALQILLEAFTKFSCLNYKYCEMTDSFILMFYNSHDRNGISHEEWRCHLPTPVCLQDFFDFVLDEQLNWIKDEEKLYEEETLLKTHLELKESSNLVDGKYCMENVELNTEFLMEDSLKYQERFKAGDLSDEDADRNQNSTKNTIISPTFTHVDTKSSYKSKYTTNNRKTAKNSESITDPHMDNGADNKKCVKTFFGYDLGDRRVEVFGKDSVYFSKDGTKVSSYYTITIPINLEHLTLIVTPGNIQNEFWMQKTFGDGISTEYSGACEAFRIISKDKLTFYVKKSWYQMSSPVFATSLYKLKNKESLSKKESRKLSSTLTQSSEKKLFHSFFITWPNGLITESVHENNSSAIAYIKQFFINPVEHIDEDMRCISLNGEVVIFKKSGILEVFRPDGTFIKIYKCEKRLVHLETHDDIRSNASSDKIKKGKSKDKSRDKLSRPSKSSKNVVDPTKILSGNQLTNYELFIDEFEIVDGLGFKQKWSNNSLISTEKLLVRTATDYCLGEVLSRRIDGTNMLLSADGAQILTFHDNTKIITTYLVEDEEIYPVWTNTEDNLLDSSILGSDSGSKISASQKSYKSTSSGITLSSNVLNDMEKDVKEEKKRTDGYVSVQVIHTIEHANFATVVINKANGKITIDSPNNTSLTVDNANKYEFSLDESTSATFDGEHLYINFVACPECQSCTKCKVKINNLKSSNDDHIWLSMKDSFSKNVVVDEEGGINVVNSTYSEEVTRREEVTVPMDCIKNEDEKFSEKLVHRILVDQYKSHCRWQPWCSINQYDTFGDYRSILSVLTPFHLTETEKWIMRSKFSDEPNQLKYKDLKTDSGKGFYHWMRPYEIFQPKPTQAENITIPTLPRAYVLRTLEQQWNDETRENLKGGREMLKAVLRYRRLLKSDCQTILNGNIRDSRTKEESCADEMLQNIAHKIYEDLKVELADDIQVRAKPTITTKPQGPRQKSAASGIEEVTCDELKKAWEENQAALVKEVEEVEKPSPSLQRYWQRRANEAKEEQFYKYLLREESVPPYFRNLLGGAAWWEINQAAGDAVTMAEGPKCACALQQSVNPSQANSTTDNSVE